MFLFDAWGHGVAANDNWLFSPLPQILAGTLRGQTPGVFLLGVSPADDDPLGILGEIFPDVDSGISEPSGLSRFDPLLDWSRDFTAAGGNYMIALTGAAGLVEPPLLLGDYNQNHGVDAADYTVWRDNLGANIALPNEDPAQTPGSVTPEDYDVWKLHFGEMAPGSSARAIAGVPGTGEAAVPEPASFLLCVFAAAWMLIHRLARPTAEQGHWKVAIWVALLLLLFPRSPAVLAQCERPMIESQPQSQTVNVGCDVRFFVEVTGTEPLVYQWRKDSTPIPGAVDPSFSIFAVQLGDAGDYGVWSVNPCGAAMSDTASLTVILAGDYNQNGVVDAADYTVWRDNLGANVALPNEDPDQTPGWVTAEDYDVWKTHFGQTAGSGSFAAVRHPQSDLDRAIPEPATLALLLIGSALLTLRRRVPGRTAHGRHGSAYATWDSQA